MTVGYIPYADTPRSVEAEWLSELLSVQVRVAVGAPSLNHGPLPQLERLDSIVGDFLSLPAVVAEGPGGLLWAALLRTHGFRGSVTVLPYVNPSRWLDVAAIALYRRFARPEDRVFLGSAPSAALYRSCGVQASVGEPYGIDDRLFGPRPSAERTRDALSIPAGRLLMFAGRAQPDKDLYRLLRVALKARVLFPDLQVVIASHVVDREYVAAARQQLGRDAGVTFVLDPTSEQLADLYNLADVFVTASTSHFDTFGRAPAEALACGSPAVAPKYDGFVDVLDQPGGTLVAVEVDPQTGTPHVDEDALLRAVYDVLSNPCSPPRQEISATARRRFGRSATISLLGYLGGRSSRPPLAQIAPVAIDVPAEWEMPLAEIAGRDAPDSLAWFWTGCDHERFAAQDDDFSRAVRRTLCVSRRGAEEVLIACP